jgi:hypothetical protein
MDKQDIMIKALEWFDGLDSDTQDNLSERLITDYYIKNILEN